MRRRRAAIGRDTRPQDKVAAYQRIRRRSSNRRACRITPGSVYPDDTVVLRDIAGSDPNRSLQRRRGTRVFGAEPVSHAVQYHLPPD